MLPPLSCCLSFLDYPSRPLFSKVSAYGGDGTLCQELQKPNGFPHPTRLDQTSLLTSVATGYYFTELTNFRWGAVIKWSGMKTCSCLLVPQVFTSPKKQLKTLQQLESSICKPGHPVQVEVLIFGKGHDCSCIFQQETPLASQMLPRSRS